MILCNEIVDGKLCGKLMLCGWKVAEFLVGCINHSIKIVNIIRNANNKHQK